MAQTTEPPKSGERHIKGTKPEAEKEPVERQEMEKRLKNQERYIKELESKINSALRKDVEPVLEHTKKIFAGPEYVTQAHYAVLHDRALHIIFIHSLDDRVEALTAICRNVREIMDVFPDTEVTPIILHRDEVRQDHLIGTAPIFEKMQEADQK